MARQICLSNKKSCVGYKDGDCISIENCMHKADNYTNSVNDAIEFTVAECGISTVYREINKEEYERLSAMSYSEVDEEIRAKLSDTVVCGYGYYGHNLLKKDEKYFLGRTIGNSCD